MICRAVNFQELLGGRNIEREARELKSGVQAALWPLVGFRGKALAGGPRQPALMYKKNYNNYKIQFAFGELKMHDCRPFFSLNL